MTVPPPSPRLPEWVESLLATGLVQDAVVLVEEALSVRPDDPELRIALIQSLWRAGESSGVLDEVDRFLPLARDDDVRAWMLSLRALCLLAVDRAAEADAPAREATRVAPAHPLGHLALAVVHGTRGQPTEARAAAEVLFNLAPDESYGYVAMAAAATDPAEVEEHLRRAAELDPDDEVIGAWLGEVLLERGKDMEALDLLAEVARRHPQSAEVRTLALRAAGRLEGLLVLFLVLVTGALWVVAWTVVTISDGRLGELAGVLLGLSLATGVAGRVVSRRRAPRSLVRPLMVAERRARFSGTSLTVLLAFGIGMVAIPPLWLGMFAIPSIQNHSVEVGWAGVSVPVLIMGAGLWLLRVSWRGRRVGPSRLGDHAARCRCLQLSVLTAGDAERYSRLHLVRSDGDESAPEVFRCPEMGIRWILYPMRVGGGVTAVRLARVDAGPPDDPEPGSVDI